MAVQLQLEDLLRTEPAREKLSLAFRGITDLKPLVPALSAFTALRELDLRGNALQSLPSDLSSVRTLQSLDLSQNPIRSSAAVLPGLRTLPSLRSLRASLTVEEEEKVVVGLPSLSHLNGTSLDASPAAAPPPATAGRPAVAPAPAPAGASAADAVTPGSAAVSSVGAAADGAAALPPSAPIREIAMTEGDLESVAVLYGGIKSLRGQLSSQADARLTSVFDTHIRSVMADLKARLERLDDPFLRQAEILSAKGELYDVCFQQCIDHGSDSSKEFGSVLRKLRSILQDLFGEFPRVVYDMKPYYEQRIKSLRTELTDARQEAAQLLEAAELLEREAAGNMDERDQLQQGWEAERRQLLADNEALRREVAALRGSGATAAATSAAARRRLDAAEPRARPARTGHQSAAAARVSAARAAVASSSNSKTRGAGSSAGAGAGGLTPAAPPAPPAARNLSLKQLTEVVEAIYASKVKFDAKCAEANLPRETMEQHMYTYLNQKYGLKALIIDHASSIIRAVNKYSAVDNDIGVFGRILRNEIDEEFRYVQAQLKESVKELLEVYLKGRFPLKTDEAIKEMLNNRLRGHVFEEEWVDIIKYMYNQEDALAVIVLMRDAIKAAEEGKASPDKTRGRSATERTGRRMGSRGKIMYDDFLKVLLDFQLKQHERFLSRFRAVFRTVDTDKNGVLDQGEFKRLVLDLAPTKSDADIDALIDRVDPHRNNHISFSECVNALSAELSGGPAA